MPIVWWDKIFKQLLEIFMRIQFLHFPILDFIQFLENARVFLQAIKSAYL